MKKYLYIGIGGFLGANVRFFIKSIYTRNIATPFATFMINIVGSFLLALILTLFIKTLNYKEHIKLSVTVGFLGSFTTFSTFCKEIVNLYLYNNIKFSIWYLICSVVFGVVFACVGSFVGNVINKKLLFK